jgi:hypothetical protein
LAETKKEQAINGVKAESYAGPEIRIFVKDKYGEHGPYQGIALGDCLRVSEQFGVSFTADALSHLLDACAPKMEAKLREQMEIGAFVDYHEALVENAVDRVGPGGTIHKEHVDGSKAP